MVGELLHLDTVSLRVDILQHAVDLFVEVTEQLPHLLLIFYAYRPMLGLHRDLMQGEEAALEHDQILVPRVKGCLHDFKLLDLHVFSEGHEPQL